MNPFIKHSQIHYNYQFQGNNKPLYQLWLNMKIINNSHYNEFDPIGHGMPNTIRVTP